MWRSLYLAYLLKKYRSASSSSNPQILCMSLDVGICKHDYDIIMESYSSYEPDFKPDFDDDEDKVENQKRKRQKLPAPEVNKAANSNFFNDKLKIIHVLEEMIKGIEEKLIAIAFKDSKKLGFSVSIHEQYLHKTHIFHTDFPRDFDPRTWSNLFASEYVRNDDTKYNAINQMFYDFKYKLPLTFVVYMMKDDCPSTPSGLGGTVVTSKDHSSRTYEDTTLVYTCQLTNCGICLFPGFNMHAVAPNPGIERATVVYKIILLSKHLITWDNVARHIQENHPSLIADIAYETFLYKDMIDRAFSQHTTTVESQDESLNPYMVVG